MIQNDLAPQSRVDQAHVQSDQLRFDAGDVARHQDGVVRNQDGVVPNNFFERRADGHDVRPYFDFKGRQLKSSVVINANTNTGQLKT